jgi:hypothetical protein
MNKWELLFIPLIAMIVAVLASVFRGAEEVRRRNNQRRAGGPESGRERQRPDSGGIDQFLEEIRRRQAARQDSARTSQREMRTPREEPSPVPTPVEAPPPPRRRRNIPVLEVAVETPPVPAVVVAEMPVVLPAPIAAPEAIVRQRESAVPASAVSGQVAALLKTKVGLRTTFVLREIFDAPMCRRRR